MEIIVELMLKEEIRQKLSPRTEASRMTLRVICWAHAVCEVVIKWASAAVRTHYPS